MKYEEGETVWSIAERCYDDDKICRIYKKLDGGQDTVELSEELSEVVESGETYYVVSRSFRS